MTFLQEKLAAFANFFLAVDKLTAVLAAVVAFALGAIATPELQVSALGIPAATFEPLLVALIGAVATIYGVSKG